MPALPDRSGRALPDTSDVVVIGGGYAGINAARELAAAARRSHCSRRTPWAGAPPPATAASSTRATSGDPGAPAQYGQATGTALYRETLESYELVKHLIADGGIDCDFREGGHLELAYAPVHFRELEPRAPTSPGGVDPMSSRGAHPRGDRVGRLFRGAGRRRQRAHPPGTLFRGARRSRGPRRRRPPRGRPGDAIRRLGDGRFVVETDEARSWPATCSSPRTATPTASRRRCGGGSSRSALTSSRASPCPRTWRASSRPRAAVLRHEELPVLLARVRGPPDDLRRAGIVHAHIDRPDRGHPDKG